MECWPHKLSSVTTSEGHGGVWRAIGRMINFHHYLNVSAVYEKQQQIQSVKFQVHMVLNVKTDYWNVMLCSLMKKHKCFSGIHSFHIHVRRVPLHGNTRFLQNGGIYLLNNGTYVLCSGTIPLNPSTYLQNTGTYVPNTSNYLWTLVPIYKILVTVY